jgi:hypothetical protein
MRDRRVESERRKRLTGCGRRRAHDLPAAKRGPRLPARIEPGDSTFVVYDLASLRKLRTLTIGDGVTDGVDNCDGAMVVGLPLGAFTQGLLVTHDGDEEPGDDATNFKFMRWDDVADALGLAIDTTTGDPRD